MKDIKSFLILSETDTREPLYVLFRLLNNFSTEELICFIKTIVSLVEEEFLYCFFWSKKECRYISIKENLFNELQSYVKLKMVNNQLGLPEDIPDFEFIQTEKGSELLKQKYKMVEGKALKIIEKIERYKNENQKYPRCIGMLCPKYINVIEDPFEIGGSWWYWVDNANDSFLFGYFSFFGLLKVFNSENQEWIKFNS